MPTNATDSNSDTMIVLSKREFEEYVNSRLASVELQNEICRLKETVADTKQSFYDSKLNMWDVFLSVIGLIFVFLGYLGYASISDRINTNQTANDSYLKEAKGDLSQRISDIKDDFRDFKKEQKDNFTKFETDSKEKIDRGLQDELQKAIENVMKGTFSKDMNELNESVAKIKTELEELKSRPVANGQSSNNQEDSKQSELTTDEPQTDNAFGDE